MGNIEKRAYRSLEADERQGLPKGAHRVSRSTGVLCGQEPPPFVQIGKAVFYLREDLESGMDQFPRYRNTAEVNLAKQAV